MKFYLVLIVMSFTFLLTNCNSEDLRTKSSEATQKVEESIRPGFIHTVYFWFEEDADPKLKEKFIDGLENLAKVKSIQSVFYGPPAGTPRDVVDNSYDYAWITNFATSADHDAYQVDPLHLEFIDKYKALWKEVKVYDNLVK